MMDQESRDANSLLIELDRGLKSPHIGEQSEAVVRFTSLFQRHPLPILINSACLKLAEAFRNGSNFIRVQISEVFERNQIHLNKIYNVDELYRILFTVTTSNDPIARSITLLTLGHVAPVVANYKSVHHCISVALESKNECELNAAIACAASYVKHSAEFACNIYSKIVSIFDSSKASLDMKLRALSVLDHGFYNANDAMTVRWFLIDVIDKTNNRRLICSCLTLSTKIAYTSLSHITSQIELLLKIFAEDQRQAIKLNALKNLRFLAEKSPHIWETSHVNTLILQVEKFIPDDKQDIDPETGNDMLYLILSIFCKLLNCPCNFISQAEKYRIFKQCSKFAFTVTRMPLFSMGFDLMTIIFEESLQSTENNIEEHADEFRDIIITIIQKTISSGVQTVMSKKSDPKQPQQEVILNLVVSHGYQKSELSSLLRKVYRDILTLCKIDSKMSMTVTRLIMEQLLAKTVSLENLNPYVTELLCAIVQVEEDSISNDVTSSAFMDVLQSRKEEVSQLSETNLLNLCVLHFQTLARELQKGQKPDVDPESLTKWVTCDRTVWFGFKVMREAMRYGHYKHAKLICQILDDQLTTDTMDFYFKSLHHICTAEWLLTDHEEKCSQETSTIDLRLKQALSIYEVALSPLRASIGHCRTNDFQIQLLWLRIRVLQAHSTLRECCQLYENSPITYSTLLNIIGATRGNYDPAISRLGVMQQMPKISKEFRYLGECYENLSSVSFDCDNSSLDYLYLLKCSCVIMADAIDAIFQYGKNLPVMNKLTLNGDRVLALEQCDLKKTLIKLLDEMRKNILIEISAKDETIDPLISTIKSMSHNLLECRYVYPRYFFQPLQMTKIKLAITPQPSSSSDTITLMLDQNLVLKVEGLIQNLSRVKKTIRNISKIMISASMYPTKMLDQNFSRLFVQSTATPRNSYFKTEFLLPLKVAGLFSLDIEVSIIDEQEQIWKTGPTEKLNIKISQ